MADVPFSFFVILGFYFLKKWEDIFNWKKGLFLGILSGLAILTRFEGYILFGGLGLGILFFNKGLNDFKFDLKSVCALIKENLSALISFVAGTLLTILPWLVYRNPFVSTYFEEPAGRTYDAKMVWIYVVSLLFCFGVVPFFTYLIKGRKKVWDFLCSNVGILGYVVVELVLILVWPAAVPRLFVPVIPFFILFFVLALDLSAETPKFKLFQKKNVFNFKDLFNLEIIMNALLLVVFAGSQYFLKLQFLILDKKTFVLIIFLNVLLSVAFFFKKEKFAYITAFSSLLFWSLSTICLHKDIFISVKNAGAYMQQNISGVVAYNDVSSVTDWYLNYAKSPIENSGFYYNTDERGSLDYETLAKTNIDYLLITNEHNTTMTLDLERRPHLEVLKDFTYNVNSGDFFAKIIKFNRK
jgi:hypothetical protein